MSTLEVTVVGAGAIGSTVARALAAGEVAGARLRGVVVRRPETAEQHGLAAVSLDEALAGGDLLVECAGVAAVADLGPRAIAAGNDVLITSVGALADTELRALLLGGPGQLSVTSGAIGGLDLLTAASRAGGLDSIRLTTAKAPATVVQPWMDARLRERVLDATEAVEAFSGTVAEAIERFPASLNVAVALAHATGMWDAVTVTMVADPRAELTTHRIEARGRAGEYDFTIRNRPHPDNPATSGIVPQAVLAGIARLARPGGAVV